MAKKEAVEEPKKGKEDTFEREIPADAMLDEEGNIIEEGGDKKPDKPEGSDKEGDKEPLPKPSDTFKPKHVTWEETEKARIESEKKMHEATTRASRLEKEIEQFKKPSLPKTPTVDDAIAEITDDAIRQINALPIEYGYDGKPSADSIAKRDRESFIIMNKANRKIARLEIDEDKREASTWQKRVTKLTKKATDEGLKTDDEIDMVAAAYDRLRDIDDPDFRADEAVRITKERLERLRSGFVNKEAKDKEEKDALRVLGRGSDRPKGKEAPASDKPSTMTDAMTKIRENRRVKREDLR